MRNTIRRNGKMTLGTRNNSAYMELLKTFPPRPITKQDELIATQTVIDSLIDKGDLTTDEQDYLNVLGTLVYEYEQKQEQIPDIHGVELIKALLVEFDVQEKDLIPIFKTESITSEVLSGSLNLTTEHISKLAEFFHVSPAVFFEK
jgi:HTH-type transcriptional regulator / antitoxin HigA